MDESTDRGSKEKDESQGVDLTDLQNFNFASNWSESTNAPARHDRDARRPGGGERRQRPDRRPIGGGAGGSARSESQPGGGDRRERRPEGPREHRRPDRGARREEPPHQVLLRESPFEIQLLPEEPILATLTQAMRQSLRTYELFEVARLILEKPDRYQIGLRFHGNEAGQHGVRPLYQSVPDGLPFLSEEAAVDHVMRNHLDLFFAVEEVEVDPPKGNFQFIARCTLTGEFLSPPNYHRYQPILLQYHQERFPDMPFDRFRSQIETVKDEEAIGQWLQSMTKQTRFRVVGGAEGEGETLDSPEAARVYLLRQGKEKVVQPVKSLKFSGKLIDALSSPDIRPYVVAFVEHQKRFPLDTANTLRGRLRRQHFFIYKKGSRGVSLVCAVKRKFRQPNQVFSDSVQALINFLEANDQIHASELSEKFLGFSLPGEGEERVIDAEEQAKIKRLSLDLRWLLSEGYVTEYSDGRLSVHPVAAQGGEKKPSAKAKAGDESSSIPDKPAEEPVETPPEEPAVSSAPDRVSEAVQDEERGQPEQEADSSEKPEPPVSIATDSGGGEDREAERADPEEGVSSGSERPKEG